MRYQYLKPTSIPIQVILFCGIGVVLGLLSVWLPSYFLMLGIGALIYITVVWRWPEYALLLILLLLSTAIDENALPSIPIGVGHIIVSDIILFSALAIIIIRGWSDPGFGLSIPPGADPFSHFGVWLYFRRSSPSLTQRSRLTRVWARCEQLTYT